MAWIMKKERKLFPKALRKLIFIWGRKYFCLDKIQNSLGPNAWHRLPLDRWSITGVAEFAKEMEEKNLGKPKISLQFQLTESGLTTLLKAEASVEETYTVEEEVEVDDDEEEGDAAEGDAAAEEEEKKEDDAEERKLEEDGEAKNDTEAEDAEAGDEKKDKKEEEKPKKKKKTIKQEVVSVDDSIVELAHVLSC